MNLLTDFFELDTLHVVNESSKDNKMRVRGIFGRADEFNRNNRRYPKTVLAKEYDRLLPLVKENRILGELDHPDYHQVKLINASHKVTNLWWDGNKLMGEAVILNTPAGLVTQQLIKDGVSLGISSRGLGTLNPLENGKFEVNEDYKMITFDLVADPSTRGAAGYVTESVENRKIKFDKTKKQMAEESVLLTLLSSKIKEGFTSGGDATFTGQRVGQAAFKSKKPHADVKAQVGRIRSKMPLLKRRKFDKGASSVVKKIGAPSPGVSQGPKLPNLPDEAKLKKKIGEGLSTGTSAGMTGTRIGNALKKHVKSPEGLKKHNKNTPTKAHPHGDPNAKPTTVVMHDSGMRKKEEQARRIGDKVKRRALKTVKGSNNHKLEVGDHAQKVYKKHVVKSMQEGLTTGDNPKLTGIRVGKVSKYGANQQRARIANKIKARHTNPAKAKDAESDFTNGVSIGKRSRPRKKVDTSNRVYSKSDGKYRGNFAKPETAKKYPTYEGRTTGTDAIVTGNRLGGFPEHEVQGVANRIKKRKGQKEANKFHKGWHKAATKHYESGKPLKGRRRPDKPDTFTEGISTGTGPFSTGERVGKGIIKSNKSIKHLSAQTDRIRSKMANKDKAKRGFREKRYQQGLEAGVRS